MAIHRQHILQIGTTKCLTGSAAYNDHSYQIEKTGHSSNVFPEDNKFITGDEKTGNSMNCPCRRQPEG
jgi:hypothetical protein